MLFSGEFMSLSRELSILGLRILIGLLIENGLVVESMKSLDLHKKNSFANPGLNKSTIKVLLERITFYPE